MVIQKMIDIKKLPIEIIIHPIVRNEHGLALSSRNIRLSPAGQEKALILFKTLSWVKDNLNKLSLSALTEEASSIISRQKDIDLEYFAICETRSLQTADRIEENKQYVALVVIWIEGVRLIDNMILN